MIFKNILRILKSYRLSLFKIIFFELFFLIRGYKGNKFNFSKNDLMTDNIPCPYYFLVKVIFPPAFLIVSIAVLEA